MEINNKFPLALIDYRSITLDKQNIFCGKKGEKVNINAYGCIT